MKNGDWDPSGNYNLTLNFKFLTKYYMGSFSRGEILQIGQFQALFFTFSEFKVWVLLFMVGKSLLSIWS